MKPESYTPSTHRAIVGYLAGLRRAFGKTPEQSGQEPVSGESITETPDSKPENNGNPPATIKGVVARMIPAPGDVRDIRKSL